MFLSPRLLLSALVSTFSVVSNYADETEAAAPESSAAEAEKAPVAEPVDVVVGTKLFDAATVGELFETYQAENERLAKERAAQLNSGELQIIELAPLEVGPYDLHKFKELAERIDPRPQQRLARLAELDPKAAADLRVTMRAEERFFAGEDDATIDANAGRTADVDFRKATVAAVNAAQRVSKAMQGKKVTDDQPSVPAAE